jgi:DNA-directed RNA polymerase subunit RPC12/RpoP
MDDSKVKCPRCGSEQIHAEKRGWNMWTGDLGSGKIILTCLKCSNKFKPGEG